MVIGPLQLIRQATPGQRRTLLAAAMGWALDAFDAMLYSLVLALLMRDLGMSKTVAGTLGTLTLLASGIGGVLFGFLADRIGRKHALMASILTYSVCSFASGLAKSIAMLAVARFVLGLGMGGEWNTGATLVAESWPTEFRAKAISIVQSSWALGFAAAALVAGPVARYCGWRAVFFVGILPAVITLWIQRRVPESGMWREQHGTAGDHDLTAAGRDVRPYNSTKFSVIFRAPYARHTFALLLFNFFGMFAWWGLFTCIYRCR
jgi:MFS family permease